MTFPSSTLSLKDIETATTYSTLYSGTLNYSSTWANPSRAHSTTWTVTSITPSYLGSGAVSMSQSSYSNFSGVGWTFSVIVSGTVAQNAFHAIYGENNQLLFTSDATFSQFTGVGPATTSWVWNNTNSPTITYLPLSYGPSPTLGTTQTATYNFNIRILTTPVQFGLADNQNRFNAYPTPLIYGIKIQSYGLYSISGTTETRYCSVFSPSTMNGTAIGGLQEIHDTSTGIYTIVFWLGKTASPGVNLPQNFFDAISGYCGNTLKSANANMLAYTAPSATVWTWQNQRNPFINPSFLSTTFNEFDFSQVNAAYIPVSINDLRGKNYTTVYSFDTAGFHYFIVPTGVTTMDILTVGAGDSGGSSFSPAAQWGGGGGGGGQVWITTKSVTPGNILRFNVGAGGQVGVAQGGQTIVQDITASTLVTVGLGPAYPGPTANSGGGSGNGGSGFASAGGGGGGASANGAAAGDAGGGGGGGGPYTPLWTGGKGGDGWEVTMAGVLWSGVGAGGGGGSGYPGGTFYGKFYSGAPGYNGAGWGAGSRPEFPPYVLYSVAPASAGKWGGGGGGGYASSYPAASGGDGMVIIAI